ELRIEDLIPDETAIITITHSGYIKRTSLDLYRQQRRGGKGVSGIETKEEDFVEDLFVASSHDYILFFTENGRIHWLKVYEIPQAGRYSMGKAIVNLLDLRPDEKIATLIRVRDFNQPLSVVLVTKEGTIKKTSLDAFANPRRGGIAAITIGDKDVLVAARLVSAKDDLFLATRLGQSIRFHASQIRDMGRTAQGVRGIRLGKHDAVVGMEIFKEDGTILIVTEKGYGKRTLMSQYRVQSRGGKGVITMKTKDRNGPLVNALSIKDNDEVMMISTKGKMIRTRVNGISVIGRNTQGVRVLSLDGSDKLVAVCKVIAEESEKVDEIAKGEDA
ncbi:MAG: DNA gyrase C-terminal beta-propeller domain-containing protein, partial [Chlamydiota bacterium]|nr:DNA gyrase C-terminal beta-propeller domain-containing protein [Chlamydiota bacterium]